MKILFYRYGSICEPDIIAGFQELGNEVSQLDIEVTNKNISATERLKKIADQLFLAAYDFVFSINYYPVISEVCNVFKIRYLCWTVDSPVMDLYSNTLKNPWNRVFLFDQDQYRTFSPINPSCIFHMPLASNPKRWNQVIQSVPKQLQAQYQHDIAFVGSLYTEKCPYDRLTQASDYLIGYLTGLMEAQLKIYGYYFLEEVLPDSVVDEFKSHLPGFYTPLDTYQKNDKNAMCRLYLDGKMSALERTRLLDALGRHFQVGLYTGSDTAHLSVKSLGLATTLTQMPLIFHNSKINLNITSKSIREGLPLRIFDILGCGGFLITNFQSELPTYFSIGTDLVVYESEDDLLSKCDYYLTHESDRMEIAHNGYEKLVQYHNYPERLLDMISLAFLHKEEKTT
ncbi:MAG: DUF3880 domain-containing protein [Lachnospiraceae bacterium]